MHVVISPVDTSLSTSIELLNKENSRMKTAMVSGISVQNGANFTEFLLEKCRQVNRTKHVKRMRLSQLDELCSREILDATCNLTVPDFIDVSSIQPATTAQTGRLAQSTPQSQMTSCHPHSPYVTETSVADYSAFLDA